nr:LCP family protein [uncultured Sellimonas sp.]
MAQRENGNSRREEYRRMQIQNRKPEENRRRKSDSDYNLQSEVYQNRSAQGTTGKRKRPPKETEQDNRNSRQRDRMLTRRMERKAERAGVARGMVLFALQLFVSLAFIGLVCWLDILIIEYLIGIAGILLVLLGITLVSQLAVRGKAKIVGKIFSIFISMILIVGSFYLYQTGGALLHMTAGGVETHKMVVVVRESDKADKLSDLEDEVFGVQYTTDAENTDRALANVNKKLKKHVETEVYDDMSGLANALINKDVNAIIYDANYEKAMEQAVDGFAKKTKVVYSYKLETNSQDVTLDLAVQSEPFTVYISGIDKYGDVKNVSRSDVNIIATVNPQTHQILLVTTPRDYYVPIPGISGGQRDKLTHAGNYGVEVSISTLEELYQVEIPFYARLNFTSFIDIIDILGGVDVNSELAFTTGTDAGAVVEIKEGVNHLDGKEALAFARERHALSDGDNQRGKNQEALITAMIQKMVSPSMIVNATDILKEAADSVETNMSMKQIRTLIKQQLREHADWKVCSVAAEGTEARDVCYSAGNQPLYVTVPDEESVVRIADMINRVEAGEILEESVTADGK